jgi:hypothetical protein
LGLATAAAQDAGPTFSVTISTDRSVFKSGEDIKLKEVISNPTDRPFWIDFYGGPEADRRRLVIRDVAGKPPEKVVMGYSPKERRTVRVHPREAGKDIILGVEVGSGGYGFWQPGTRGEHAYNLTNLYDLSAPGKYTIQVRRTGNTDLTPARAGVPPDPAKTIVVYSNVLTITITP